MEKLKSEKVKRELSDLLNDCLQSMNQDQSFIIKKVDLDKMKCIVEFDIVIIEEDNYIGFQGY